MANKREKQLTILRGLNSVQKEAVLHTEGPSLILAGAGSGKTRVLTHKIAYLIKKKGVSPDNILAMTFTNKAANEMKERISQLLSGNIKGLWIGTFHSNFARILRKNCEKIGYSQNFVIYDEADSLSVIKTVLNEMQDFVRKTVEPKRILAYIKFIKNSAISLEDFRLRRSDLTSELVTDIYRRYNARLKENGAMDFEDLLGNCYDLFSLFPDVLGYYQNLFKYILVDEYQDTNRIQYLVLKLLAAKHGNITVVGDDDQSIYRWRGAEIRNILDFEADFPKCKIFRLEQNYRSTQNILNVANSIIVHNRNRMEKELWTKKEDGEKITLKITDTSASEAEYVVQKIQEEIQKNNRNFSDFAVLFRINAQSRALEEALQSYGINYVVVGGIRFYERKEIKDILAYLRVLVNPDDSVSLKRIINFPARGIGKATIDKLEQFASREKISLFDAIEMVDKISSLQKSKIAKLKTLHQVLNRYRKLGDELSPAEIASALIDEIGIFKILKEENTEDSISRMDNIKELLNGIKEFSIRFPNQKLENYLENVALITSVDNWDRSVNAVSLLTLHSAKGLEFPVVFITGLEEGLFPLSRQSSLPEDLEEERRLFYVGATRAMEKLYLTACVHRQRNGAETNGAISRFINELDKKYIEVEEEEFNDKRTYSSRRDIRQEKIRMAKQKLEKAGIKEIKMGALVKHPRYGRGIVHKIDYPHDPENTKVTVYFENVGEKRLYLKYAKLEIIQ